MSSPKANARLTFWGSIALAIFVCLIFIPLVPSLGPKALSLLSLLDVRQWSKSTWLLANSGILALLVGIRFAPSIKQRWRNNKSAAGR